MENSQKIAAARLEILKKRSKEDLYFFAKYACGYNLFEEKPHREMADQLTKDPDILEWFKKTREQRALEPVKKKLLMVPRGCFKSSLASIAFPLWAAWHDPNLRIMIDSESMGTSKKFLAEQQGIIQTPMFQTIVSDDQWQFQLEPDKDKAGGFTEKTMIWKNRTIPAKEASVFCAGADTATTGSHPDIIIMDDLVSERNVTTPEQIEKVKQHYRLAFSLLEPGGILILIGTRYHMNDLYNDVLQDLTYTTYYKPAVLDTGDLFFPSRLGHDRLEDLRRTQGSYIFSSQYMLTPLNEDDAIFKESWFQYYDDVDLKGKRLNTFLTIDPAISQKETADYTGMTVTSVDPDGNMYVREYIEKRITPQEIIEQAFEFVEQYDILKVGIEAVAFQKSLIFFMRQQMRSRRNMFSIIELKADRDKVRRAHAFQPYVENGMFFIKKNMHRLKQQMIEFPFSRNDDLVDTVTYLPQIIRKPSLGTKHRGAVETYTSNSATGY